jgi:hypothetical protein
LPPFIVTACDIQRSSQLQRQKTGASVSAKFTVSCITTAFSGFSHAIHVLIEIMMPLA